MLKRFGQIANIVAVLTVTMLVSVLYPNNIKFKYDFQRGMVWKYDDLEAPFAFAIKKSQKEIEADKELVSKDFRPYYTLNEDLSIAKIKDFEASLMIWRENLPQTQLTDAQFDRIKIESRSLLEKIFSTGIVQLSAEHSGATEDFIFNVVKGNTSFKRTLASFYLMPDAQEMLTKEFANTIPALPQEILQILIAALTPNITYDEARSDQLLKLALSEVSPAKSLVNKGETIVQKGDIITDEVYERLSSYKDRFEADISSQKSGLIVYIGYLLLTALIFGAFIMYVISYRREILSNFNYLTFILVWFVAFAYLTYLVEQTEVLSVYVIPFCVVPVVVRHFFTYRLAFFTHVVVVLIAGFLTAEGHQFLFTQIVAGVVAVLAVADARNWSRFFSSILYIFIAYLLSHLGISLIEEGSFREIDWTMIGWLTFNGLLTLLAFPLIPLSERVFGFTSSISLVELSDMNRPLIRELALKAPGTFQHSLQVGNLAEAAANEIGADPLLVRVGALYHDIGKIVNPHFFVENQTGTSPHDGLNRLESARIIIEHVTEGEAIAKKHRLPLTLQNFILTHHGTTKVEYFLKNYQLENPGIELDESKFAYPGPLPNSKEEAILMLADSIEATSRSLKSPTGLDIDHIVDKIVKKKIDQGQLDHSKLTFGDLEKCRQVFKKMLRSIHHVRIEYPE